MTATANQISSSKAYVDPAGSPGTPIWTSANQVYYEAKVTFADEDNRRHFFNSGGELRFDATLTGVDAAHAQSVDWQTMLSAIATRLNYLILQTREFRISWVLLGYGI